MTFCCKSLKHNCEATNKNRNEKVFLLLKKIHSLILLYLSEYYQHFHTGKIVCMKSSLRIVIKFYIVLYFLSSFMFEIQYFLYLSVFFRHPKQFCFTACSIFFRLDSFTGFSSTRFVINR